MGRPEEEIKEKKYLADFDEVLEEVPRWLNAIEADEGVPDRWAELEQQRRAFSARALGEGDNTPFTADEQRQITGALKELMAHAQERYELSDQQTHELGTRIDYLADAVKRFGRHDWRNLVVGTLASAVAGAYLPPEAVRGVVGTLASSIGHVFGMPLPQLPAGALALLREPDAPDFSLHEARHIASLGPLLTEGLRIAVVLGAVSVDRTPSGGMLIVNDHLEILTITANAERWLAELNDGPPGLPDAIRSVVGYLDRLHDSDATEERVPRARVCGAFGRWLAIYASRTREANSQSAHTAVIIEEAKPSEIAPLIVHAYGLSPREARVTRLILQGLSTKEIAAEIHLSPYTVQDHLKVIFEKTGVRSRRELVAKIFAQHHWPRSGLGEHPPESDGVVAGIHAAEATTMSV